MDILLYGPRSFLGNSLLHKLSSSRHNIVAIFNYTLPEILLPDVEYISLDNFLKSYHNNFDIFINTHTYYNPNFNSDESLIYEYNNVLCPLEIISKLSKPFKIINFSSYFEFIQFYGPIPSHVKLYIDSKKLFKYKISEIKFDSTLYNFYLYDTYGSMDRRNKLLNNFIKAMNDQQQNFFVNMPNQLIRLTYIDDILFYIENAIQDYLTAGSYVIDGEEHTILSALKKAKQFYSSNIIINSPEIPLVFSKSIDTSAFKRVNFLTNFELGFKNLIK